MLSWIRRRMSTEGGNAAVELAMMLPLFLALVMGIIEFGRVLYFKQVITNAARESSRASATGFEPYITAANRVLSPAGIPTPYPACSTSPSQGTAAICRTIVNIPVSAANTQAHRVAISYNAAFITPLGALLDLIVGNAGLASGITQSSTAVMRQ
ncbi:pilus assembly protein [Nitrospinae bacterium AH_259_B05_G02_I21]|nr:pilus assembly protein [Nitrospinae bacterium AH_259_B05_G02_I21]